MFSVFLNELRGSSLNKSIIQIDHRNVQNLILWWTFEIVKLNPDNFYSEIYTEGKIDSWILDLTSTALMGILTEWSKKGDRLKVICDNSNLFKCNRVIDQLNHIGKANKRTKFLGKSIGFGLTENIVNLDSKREIGLQIADIFSSSVGFCLNNRDTNFSKSILKIVVQKCLCKPETYCIMPDYEILKETEKVNFYLDFMKLIWQQLRK